MKSILAWMFGIAVYLRNLAYGVGLLQAHKLDGRVISVGNIAVGGTGKSPVVIGIANYLQEKGRRCAILTRGYRGGLGASHWLVLLDGKRVAGNAPITALPDEAMMQSQALPQTPVVVGSRRLIAARRWQKESMSLGLKNPDVWILDDGFQHRGIARDLDVVLLDSSEPYGKLMPAGRFREPTESLSRAQVVLFTRSNNFHPKTGDLMFPHLMNPNALVSRVPMNFGTPQLCGSSASTSDFANTGFLLVCGIAKPEHFRQAVSSAGIRVISEYVVADHEVFDQVQLGSKVAAGVNGIITTAKDFARCPTVLNAAGVPVYILPMIPSLPDDFLRILNTSTT